MNCKKQTFYKNQTDQATGRAGRVVMVTLLEYVHPDNSTMIHSSLMQPFLPSHCKIPLPTFLSAMVLFLFSLFFFFFPFKNSLILARTCPCKHPSPGAEWVGSKSAPAWEQSCRLQSWREETVDKSQGRHLCNSCWRDEVKIQVGPR